MPPPAPPPALIKPHKPYFFYGHRKPTQNRPTVRGGLFSNRQTLNLKKFSYPTTSVHEPFDLQKWDPDEETNQKPPLGKDPSEKFFSLAKNLSPIGRYIVDAFRKHKQWSPQLVAELNRLRRVTPKLVAEVLKFPDVDPRLSSKFFHWAGMQEAIFQVLRICFLCVLMTIKPMLFWRWKKCNCARGKFILCIAVYRCFLWNPSSSVYGSFRYSNASGKYIYAQQFRSIYACIWLTRIVQYRIYLTVSKQIYERTRGEFFK